MAIGNCETEKRQSHAVCSVPPDDQRFPRRQRLSGGRRFRQVFARRSSASDGLLVVYACANRLPYSRLGLSVSRKMGPATARNRWKRLLREAFRRNKRRLPAGFDLVVVTRPSTRQPVYARLERSLIALAGRAAQRAKRRPPGGDSGADTR